jgi:hypothetical protein
MATAHGSTRRAQSAARWFLGEIKDPICEESLLGTVFFITDFLLDRYFAIVARFYSYFFSLEITLSIFAVVAQCPLGQKIAPGSTTSPPRRAAR